MQAIRIIGKLLFLIVKGVLLLSVGLFVLVIRMALSWR